MNIRAYRDTLPTLGASTWVDESARVIGDVVLGEDVSVWPFTVVRGDVNFIRIGDRTNIQDGTVVHVSHDGPHAKLGGFATRIGSDVTIDGWGNVLTQFDSGATLVAGRLAIARFPREARLATGIDGVQRETAASGEPLLGRPLDPGRGSVSTAPAL